MDIEGGEAQGAGGEIGKIRGLARTLRGWFQRVCRILCIFPPSPEVLGHPIVENLRNQELGKTVLGVAVPVTTGLIIYFSTQESPPPTVRFSVVALSIGCTAIWNGLLLREAYPLTANAAEQVGVAIVLVTFHGLVGSFLPPEYLWIPGLFGILTMAPFILAALPP